jgi:diguanylate cyclase (GGDEF)-like protein
MPALRRPTVRTFVAATAAGALLCAGWDVWTSLGVALTGPRPDVFWLLGGCCLATELRPLRWLRYSGGGEVTGSWTFMMAMLMVASPLAAVGVSATLFVAGDVVARKAPVKIVFNLGQIVVALSLGAGILHLWGQQGAVFHSGSPDATWFALVAGACVVAFAANTLLTAVIIGLSQCISVRSVLREHGSSNLPTDAMLLALSPIFVVVAERSLFLVVPLLATTWAVYHSARLALVRQHEATHDPLTQLPNQRALNHHLVDALGAGRDERLGLVLIDLDEFKRVNDGLGRSVGDQVLTLVAERLTAALGPADFLARLSGDEFAVVAPGLHSVAAAEEVACRLLGLFDRPVQTKGFPVAVRASIGVAVYPDHADDAATLLRRADEAMYAAKTEQSSPRLYRLDRDDAQIGRLGLLADLVRAVGADDELFLEFQPQVRLADGAIVGVEALLRWRHPAVGLVQPATFMPLAEQTELIGPVTEWVLARALHHCARWHEQGRDLIIAVNVSVRNLQEIRFPRVVEAALAEAGVAPSSLVLEITENTVGLDRTTVRTVIGELRQLGVAISIDDFGTGYSSIVQLRELPVDQVKLDRRFVANMANDGRDALIVRTILRLGTALGIQTVAEGVEEELVAGMLHDLGCEQAQGYLFARPMGPDRLLRWIASREAWKLPAEAGPAPAQEEANGGRGGAPVAGR